MTVSRIPLFALSAACLFMGMASAVDAATLAAPLGLDIASESDSGIADDDNVTNIPAPFLSGTGAPHALITVLSDGVLNDRVMADADGNWSFRLSVLAEGTHAITASADDQHGAVSSSSEPLMITIDRTAPAVTAIAYTPSTTTDQEVEASVSESSEPVYELESASLLAPHAFADNGEYAFRFRDAAGNEGTATATVSWIDHQLPVITLTGDAAMNVTRGDVFMDPGATATDHLGATTTVTVSGSVDTATVGTYVLTYDATDAEGKQATSVTRSVTVAAPVSRGGGGGGHSRSSRSSTTVTDTVSAPEATTTPALAGEVLGASTYHFARDLTIGATGEDVHALQSLLMAAGYFHEAVTAYFGPVTQAAVRQYQADRGIDATGYVGQLTRSVLNAGTTAPLSEEAKIKLLADLYAQLAALLAKR